MLGVINRTAITAGVSGTLSTLTGGKFANGAVSGAFVHLFNDEAIAFSQYRSGDGVAFGDRTPSKTTQVLGRFGSDAVKGIKGVINNVNQLILLRRENDPMFEMLRYKAIGQSSNVKLLEIQPDINDLNIQKNK